MSNDAMNSEVAHSIDEETQAFAVQRDDRSRRARGRRRARNIDDGRVESWAIALPRFGFVIDHISTQVKDWRPGMSNCVIRPCSTLEGQNGPRQ